MSTTASVSRVALKLRKAEMEPRVTRAVSTGTISAACWRAFSFSASAARLAAAAAFGVEAPGVLLVVAAAVVPVPFAGTVAALVSAAAGALRPQPRRRELVNRVRNAAAWPTAGE